MNAYFERIRAVANSKEEVPSRIKFMLQDLLELRGSNWKPRRAEATAKTIEEVCVVEPDRSSYLLNNGVDGVWLRIVSDCGMGHFF